MSRLLRYIEQLDLFRERPKCAPAVRKAQLLVKRNLAHRAGLALWNDMRVVAEPLSATPFENHPPRALALGDHLVAVRHDEHRDASIPAHTRLRDVTQRFD